MELARHCTEQEYHALKEALYLAKRHQYVKDFITHRLNIINESTDEEVIELCQGLQSTPATIAEEGDDNAEAVDGYSKENILRRLNIDMEHIDKILCDDVIAHGDNLGEIDGGGDDQGGKSFTGDDEVDDNEFQDAK